MPRHLWQHHAGYGDLVAAVERLRLQARVTFKRGARTLATVIARLLTSGSPMRACAAAGVLDTHTGGGGRGTVPAHRRGRTGHRQPVARSIGATRLRPPLRISARRLCQIVCFHAFLLIETTRIAMNASYLPSQLCQTFYIGAARRLTFDSRFVLLPFSVFRLALGLTRRPIVGLLLQILSLVKGDRFYTIHEVSRANAPSATALCLQFLRKCTPNRSGGLFAQ